MAVRYAEKSRDTPGFFTSALTPTWPSVAAPGVACAADSRGRSRFRRNWICIRSRPRSFVPHRTNWCDASTMRRCHAARTPMSPCRAPSSAIWACLEQELCRTQRTSSRRNSCHRRDGRARTVGWCKVVRHGKQRRSARHGSATPKANRAPGLAPRGHREFPAPRRQRRRAIAALRRPAWHTTRRLPTAVRDRRDCNPAVEFQRKCPASSVQEWMWTEWCKSYAAVAGA
jgi:hypothetical protein